MPAYHQHSTTPYRGTFWACLWYAVTLGIWLASWGIEPLGEPSAASLTALAIFAELASVALRWKYLSASGSSSGAWHAPGADKTSAELVWLCAWGGQANALGLVAMLSPSLSSMLPGLIVTAMVEALLLPEAPFAGRAIEPRVTKAVNPEPAAAAPPTIELAPIESDDAQWTRSTCEGHTETGARFLSGWVRFELAADQKAAALTIGFSPAFPSPPDVELDQEVESEESHCETLVEHVTPAGMRVSIKRTAVGSPLVGKVLWHAAESDRSATLLSTRLP